MLSLRKKEVELEELFCQNYERLLGWSVQLTGGDRSAAEDLLHDVYVLLSLHQPDPAAIGNVEGYLYTMLRNLRLSQLRRAALIGGLEGGAETRASVLVKVANNEAFSRQELNRAFVLTEYFGYLQRDPDSGQDSDLTGYNFWLGKLDEHGGNYVEAEMVKSFLDSVEYRKRFGPE